jgi:hypothetical protein
MASPKLSVENVLRLLQSEYPANRQASHPPTEEEKELVQDIKSKLPLLTSLH